MHGNLISKESDNQSSEAFRVSKQWQRFYLKRLIHLVALRKECDLIDSVDLRLLDKAIYCTLCDCMDLGVGDDARSILRHEGDVIQGDSAN
jgi:hypothetical protein